MPKERLRLDDLDQSKSITQEEYKTKLRTLQLELLSMQLKLLEKKVPVIFLMEGPDAAGKGGTIKRVFERLDPRLLSVHTINKPTEEEFARHYAYREINEFERLLHDDGAIIVKIWLQITKQEQMARFKKRAADPMKNWKITEEDWRNRNKWTAYLKAAEDMFVKTSPDFAPWQVIPANYKWYARVKALDTVCKRLGAALGVK